MPLHRHAALQRHAVQPYSAMQPCSAMQYSLTAACSLTAPVCGADVARRVRQIKREVATKFDQLFMHLGAYCSSRAQILSGAPNGC